MLPLGAEKPGSICLPEFRAVSTSRTHLVFAFEKELRKCGQAKQMFGLPFLFLQIS